MTEIKNSVMDLIKYFGCVDRPVTPAEFKDFWQSLTEAEKDWYKTQPLI